MARGNKSAEEMSFGLAVGRELARRRAECEISGNALAGRAGISVDTIRSIETGRISSPGLYAMTRLTTALGISLDAVAAAGSAAIGPTTSSTATQEPGGALATEAPAETDASTQPQARIESEKP